MSALLPQLAKDLAASEQARPATDAQVARVLALHAQGMRPRYERLRAWAAGRARGVDETELRRRLAGWLEQAGVPEAPAAPSPAGMSPEELKTAGFAIAVSHLRSALTDGSLSLQDWFVRLRPRLVALVPVLVPAIFELVRKTDGHVIMQGFGLTVTGPQAAALEAMATELQDETLRGVKAFCDRLLSHAPIDAAALADALIEDLRAAGEVQRTIRDAVAAAGG